MTALSGENYYYLIHGEGERTIIRVEIDKDLSSEDLLFWKERIISFLAKIMKES